MTKEEWLARELAHAPAVPPPGVVEQVQAVLKAHRS